MYGLREKVAYILGKCELELTAMPLRVSV